MFRRAWRRLRATPIFTIFAVLSLSLGAGVTTAIYSVVASLVDTGFTADTADRLGIVMGSDPVDGRRQTWRSVISRADLIDLQSASAPWRDAVVVARFSQSVVTPSASELVSGEAVSGRYFSALGLSPFRGRLIQPSDDASPSTVAVIGHQFWRVRLGEDPNVVGSTIRIGGQPFEVIGIAPEGFGGLTDRIQSFTGVWVPFGATAMFPSTAAPPEQSQDRRRRQLSLLMPLPDPSVIDSMSTELHAVGERLDREYPIDIRWQADAAPQRIARSWSLRRLDEVRREAERPLLTTELSVMAIVGLVLVVACTNLANLVLARASTRQHELAVRRALGASRMQLIREELAETSLVAALGAVGVFIVTRTLMVWFASSSLPIAQSFVVQIDPKADATTVAVAAGSVLGSLFVFGLIPAIQTTRGQLRGMLATDGGATGQLRWRARRRLIALQVAISLSFFLIAAFAVRVALGDRLRASGIDIDRLAIGVLNFRLPPWTATRALDVVDRVEQMGASHPGLESVAVSSGLPFGTTYTPFAELAASSSAFDVGHDDAHNAPLLAATPSIFQTLGVPIVRGRAFDRRDTANTSGVAVLSQKTATQVFGTDDVVGRVVQMRSGFNMQDRGGITELTVIGVAGDTDTQRRYSRELGVIYLPLAQHYEPTLSMIGRGTDADEALGAIRSLARRADPDLVVDHPATAAMMLTGAFVLVSIVSRAAGALALLALVLAMAGLFGVLSHLVARRTREVGLRMALGADPIRIRRLVVGDGLRPVMAGIALGWSIGLLVRFVIRAIYNSPLSVNDAIVFGLAPLPIVVAALAACYWPARRAAEVDPNVALRDL